MYVNRDKTNSLADFLSPYKITPLDYAIANDFIDSLSEEEKIFLDDLIAGFKLSDAASRRRRANDRLNRLVSPPYGPS